MTDYVVAGPRNPFRVFLDVPGLCTRQARRALLGLQPGADHRRVRIAALILCLTGVVGDAVTTMVALRTGLGAEANPFVLAVGGVLGMELWLVLTAVICTFIALPILGKPDHPYGYIVSLGCAVVMASKLALTVSNIMVMTGHGGFI